METQIYIVNLFKMKEEVRVREMNNKEFKEEAERQGTVYLLKDFEGYFNEGEIHIDDCFIRFL